MGVFSKWSRDLWNMISERIWVWMSLEEARIWVFVLEESRGRPTVAGADPRSHHMGRAPGEI